MPVFEQGYRRYVGERSTANPAPVIAFESVRTRMRWWCWLLLLGVNSWPYGVFAVMIWLQTIAVSMFGGNSIIPLSPPTYAFETQGTFQPGAVIGLIQQNPLGLIWEVLYASSLFGTAVFPAIVGAGLLASDRRTGALQIYFSRPVSRANYLLGKTLACTFFVALTTAIPCLVLWVESVAFGSTSSYTWRTWAAPFVAVGASAFYALWTVALILALSSAMRRPAFVAIFAIFINFLLEAVGAILSETMRGRGGAEARGLGEGWRVIQPSCAIGTMTAPLCGLKIPDYVNVPLAAAIAIGVPAALLWLVWWRLRAVEVST